MKNKILIFSYALISAFISILIYIPSFLITKIFNQIDLNYQIFYYFITILLARIIFAFFSRYLGGFIRIEMAKKTRDDLLKKILVQDIAILDSTNFYKLGYSITSVLNNKYANLISLVDSLAFIVPSIIYSTVFLLTKNVYLFFYVFVVFILCVAISLWFKNKYNKTGKPVIKAQEKFAADFGKIFSSYSTASLLNQKQYFVNLITKKNTILYQKNQKLLFFESLNEGFITVVFALLQLGTIVLGIFLFRNKIQQNISDLTSIIYVSGLLVAPLFRANQLVYAFTQYKISSKVIEEKIANWAKNDSYNNQENWIEKVESFTVKNFSYFAGNNKIENLNFSLKKGDILKIEGPSGIGKSTFLHLIISKLTNYEGQIWINHQNLIQNVNFKIGLIRQKNSVFSISLRENISFSKNSENDQKIKKILNKMGLKHFVSRLDEQINEFENNISGGEMRRLELARLLYFDTELVILDEPFVGIDEKQKIKIIDILQTYFKNKIVIFTSHDKKISFQNKILKIKKFLKKPS